MFKFINKLSNAFTLSEVLITLGVIGIIAALTLPTLISHYKTKEAGSRLKKFYSAMSQAILLSENDNGPSSEWLKTYYVTDGEGNYDGQANRNLELDYFNTYLKPYLKYLKLDENPDDMQDETTGQAKSIRIHFADGSYFNMYNGACMDLDFDINGLKQPNKAGVDVFKFIICPKSHALTECGGNKNWCSYCPLCDTREAAYNRCKTNGVFCARLIMMDNWEFSKDYPFKL